MGACNQRVCSPPIPQAPTKMTVTATQARRIPSKSADKALLSQARILFPVCSAFAFLLLCAWSVGLLTVHKEKAAMFLLWLLCGVLPPALSLDWDCEHPLTPLIKELWPQMMGVNGDLVAICAGHDQHVGSKGRRQATGCTPLVAPATPVTKMASAHTENSGLSNANEHLAFDARDKPDFWAMLDDSEPTQDPYCVDDAYMRDDKGCDILSDSEVEEYEDEGYMSELELEPPACTPRKWPEGRSLLSMPDRPIPRLTEQPPAVAARQIGEVAKQARHLEAKKAPRRQNKARSRRNVGT